MSGFGSDLLRRLAEERLEDACLLLANEGYSSAYYLAGYAIELALKARIARSFSPHDAALIHTLVAELADYEKLTHELVAAEADFAAGLFGQNPRAFCKIAEVDGEPAGFALWCYTFSSFVGRPGIYLEDLFVRPEHRRRGVARALVNRLARRCSDERLGRLEWAVLKWNAPAIAFYESLGAVAMDGWTVYRTDGDALARLGGLTVARLGARARGQGRT